MLCFRVLTTGNSSSAIFCDFCQRFVPDRVQSKARPTNCSTAMRESSPAYAAFHAGIVSIAAAAIVQHGHEAHGALRSYIRRRGLRARQLQRDL